MQFNGISFIHPYKQSGRWQYVFDIKHILQLLEQDGSKRLLPG